MCGMPPSNLQALGSPAGLAIRAARHMPPTAASLLGSRKVAKAWQKDDADTTRVLRCKCCWYGAGKNNNELTNIKTDSDPILALHLRARCGLGSVLYLLASAIVHYKERFRGSPEEQSGRCGASLFCQAFASFLLSCDRRRLVV